MPRKKKTDQSPARGSDHNPGRRVPHAFDSAMADSFPSSTPPSISVKENIVKSMQEMFSHLDPDVIYIVLSECDFKGKRPTPEASVPTCSRSYGDDIEITMFICISPAREESGNHRMELLIISGRSSRTTHIHLLYLFVPEPCVEGHIS